MNNKLLKLAAISVCAAVCTTALALSAAGCGGGGGEKQSYYGKTVTFTGEKFYVGLDKKGAYDNYGDLGECSNKKILETYWNDIDWSQFKNPPANVDAFKTMIDEAKPYEKWANLSFSVTKADTATITVNLPSAFSSWGWGTSVTMPLYENKDKLNADYPSLGVGKLEAEGYEGVGVKTDGDKMFKVSVSMNYNFYLKKDIVSFDMEASVKNVSGNYVTVQYISTSEANLDLQSKPVQVGEITSTKTVCSISLYPEITISDNK